MTVELFGKKLKKSKVSAGFDAAKGDPLGECKVTPAGFAHMTQMLAGLAGGKVVAMLEVGGDISIPWPVHLTVLLAAGWLQCRRDLGVQPSCHQSPSWGRRTNAAVNGRVRTGNGNSVSGGTGAIKILEISASEVPRAF